MKRVNERRVETVRRPVMVTPMIGIAVFLLATCVDPFSQLGGTRSDGLDDLRADARATMTVQVNPDRFGASTITPSISFVTASYTISGSGPDGATFEQDFVLPTDDEENAESEVDSGGNQYSIGDLELGPWTITVAAKNESGDVLGRGSGSIDLTDTGGAVAVTVQRITGTGTLDIAVSWPQALVDTPQMTARLTKPDGTTEDVTFTVDGGMATYTVADTATGTYLLIFSLSDGAFHRHSVVESIYIVADQTTSASFSVSESDLTADQVPEPTIDVASGEYDGPQTVTITSDTSGAQIRYTLNGTTPSATVGRVYSVPFDLTSTANLQAIAYKSGFRDSPAAVASIVITDTVGAPTVSPSEGVHHDTIEVTLTSATEGANVTYTIDGQDPVPLSVGAAYSGPLQVATDTTIRAVAYDPGDSTNVSDISVAAYTITDYAADPTFSVQGGNFSSAQTVSLSTTTTNAEVYFTTDGSTPTRANGLLYTAPLTIDANTTVEAFAIRDDWGDSRAVSQTYAFDVADPTVDIAGGTYNQEQSVALSTTTPQAEIYFTLDGSTPDADSARYQNPITIASTDTTLKAKAVRDGWNSSSEVTETYVLQAATPTLSPAGGSYSDASGTVTLSSATSGVSFSHKTDGSDPTANDGNYGNTVTLTDDTDLKVIAFKTGWTESTVVSASYDLNSTTITPPDGSGPPAGSTVDLEFPGSIDALSYDFQVSLADTFATLVEEGTALETPSYTTTATIGSGETWYWRHRANTDAGAQAWNGPYSVAAVQSTTP